MLMRCINDTDCNTAFGYVNNISKIPLHDDTSFTLRPHFAFAAVLLQLIQLYYTPVLIVLGCIGNILSVFVFFSTKLRKHSSSYYLSALAFSDTGFLAVEFITWLNLVDVPLFKKPGFCQIAIYCSHVCSFLSVWLVVLFTIERFIAVRYPLHRPVVCTVARAKSFICILTWLVLPAYSPYFIIAAPQVIQEVGHHNETFTIEVICTLVPKYARLAFYYNHLDVFFTLILPFCIIVVLNSLICRTVRQLARVRRSMTLTSRKRFVSPRQTYRRSVNDSQINRSYSHRTNSSSQSKVTQMLLVVSTVFICLNLPSYILRLWVYINEYYDILPFEEEIMGMLQHYANILFATNFGINFVLYCISGQNFRKALCSLFCPRRTRRRQEQTQATVLSECSRGANINSLQQTKSTHNGSSMETHLLKDTVIAADITTETNHYNLVVTSIH